MPRRLGSIYCFQRASQICASPVTKLVKYLSLEDTTSNINESASHDQGYLTISEDEKVARSPRFVFVTNKKSKLVFLSCREGFDTHGGCMALTTVDWEIVAGIKEESKRTIVDIVRVPSHVTDDDSNGEQKVLNMSFPGIFTSQLSGESCASPDGKYIFITTQWGSVSKVVRINLGNGKLSLIDFTIDGKGSHLSSQSVLYITKEGDAIVSLSEPNCPPIIGILRCDILKEDVTPIDGPLLAELPPINASEKFISRTSAFNRKIKDIHYDVLNFVVPNGSKGGTLQGILVLPPAIGDRKVPLIVVPHGGPHSCTSTIYTPSYAFLCGHGGYAILHCNYRGSSGFGQESIESLPGSVGSQDVEDVVSLTNYALSSWKHLDSSRIGVCGGSHGGFLAGHLIGQFPDIFKVAAMRNPVTNIATMVTTTDIPDWCYVETFGTGYYNWKTFRGPTKDELSAMWEASPIAHVDEVRAPVLIALGMSDKRVPPSQGTEYFHIMRSKGIPSKLLMYPDDDHAIDRVESEADHWINIKKWFDEHL